MRLGVTVTTKIDKRAARRNRLKRRVREVFRRNRARMPIRPLDAVLIARSGATALGFAAVRHEVLQLFASAKLIEPLRRKTGS